MTCLTINFHLHSPAVSEGPAKITNVDLFGTEKPDRQSLPPPSHTHTNPMASTELQWREAQGSFQGSGNHRHVL